MYEYGYWPKLGEEGLKDTTFLIVYTIVNNSEWSLSKKREKSYDFEINLIREKGITLNRKVFYNSQGIKKELIFYLMIIHNFI